MASTEEYGPFPRKPMRTGEARAFKKFGRLAERLRPASPGSIVPAATMVPYLQQVRVALEQALKDEAQRFSSYEWLWYLRHLPKSYWEGRLGTTAAYDEGLAAIISGWSEKPAHAKELDSNPRFRITDEVAMSLAEFTAGVRCLSQIHTNLRYAWKGVPFVLGEAPAGTATPSAEDREAIDLFDERVATMAGSVFHRTGMATDEKAKGKCLNAIPGIPSIVGPAKTILGTEARFGIETVCLDDLAKRNAALAKAGLRWWSDDSALLVALLHAASPLLTNMNPFQLTGSAWVAVTRKNVEESPPVYAEEAVAVAERVFPGVQLPRTLAGLIDKAAELKGSSWPLRHGPVVRTYANYVCLDVRAATLLLGESAQFPAKGGGPAGERRGPQFERSVQAVIDSSAYAPNPVLREFVGRPIKHDGKRKTDIDAMAVRGEQLLLVSCKSRDFSGEFDTGLDTEIANVSKLAMKAIRHWDDMMEFFREHPDILKGVDLRSFQLVPIVCLPFVPYLHMGRATEFALPGLRTVVSLEEFQQWLPF